MIIKNIYNDMNVTFIDGFLTRKRIVDEFLREKSIEALCEDPSLYKFQKDNPNLSDLDNKYVSLLSFYKNEFQKKEGYSLLYIVPSFQKPKYSQIIRELKMGTYRVDELELLKYGPKFSNNKCRKDRYRQLIFIEPKGDESSCDDDPFIETIDKTPFTDFRTNFGYQPSTMSGDIFKVEVDYFTKKLSDSLQADKLKEIISNIKMNSDISIYQILKL